MHRDTMTTISPYDQAPITYEHTVVTLLPKNDTNATAYVEGLAASATNHPYAFSTDGTFNELHYEDAYDRFTAADTVTFGQTDRNGAVVAAALLSRHEGYIDIEDVYNNGPKGDGSRVMQAALRYASGICDHVVIGILRGNASIAEVYQRIGFVPYLESRDIIYLHLGDRARIARAANILEAHNWDKSAIAADENIPDLPSNVHRMPVAWLLGERQSF